MQENPKSYCPDCGEETEAIDRRDFIRVLGASAAALTALGSLPVARAADAPKAATKNVAAEEMIRELYTGLSADQKSAVVMPYDHGSNGGKGLATRLGMYNRPIGKRVGEVYTPAQQELAERILKSICADEEGYKRISRNGKFDSSGSFQGIGATIFGDPTGSSPWATLFTGHHLTVRCDGNFQDGIAWGGPMYYGHSAPGYSDRNVYNFQTKSVWSVFEALSADQRQEATVQKGRPGEQAPSIRFRQPGEKHPGIPFASLTQQQKDHVEKVMRVILSPFRAADADEVMAIIKANGGLEKLHLAFYKEGGSGDKEPWSFWRLEGPGFVWNYRILDHVHCFVNIAKQA
jgi:hypothetical protein